MLRLSKVAIAKKLMEERGGKSIKTFRRFCCLKLPKILVGNPYSAVIQKKSCRAKVYGKEAGVGMGEYQDFPSTDFCLTVPKNFVKGPFCPVSQKSFGSGKS